MTNVIPMYRKDQGVIIGHLEKLTAALKRGETPNIVMYYVDESESYAEYIINAPTYTEALGLIGRLEYIVNTEFDEHG